MNSTVDGSERKGPVTLQHFSQLMPTHEKIPSTLAYAEIKFKNQRKPLSEQYTNVC